MIKNLAVYNNTIISWNELEEVHDKNIYLSHCWKCDEIIGSREGAIREEGFYLCIHCGSEPQKRKIYYPGKICPKCGSYNMNNSYCSFTSRMCTCLKCRYSIDVK